MVSFFFYNFATVFMNTLMMNEDQLNLEKTNRTPNSLRQEPEKAEAESQEQQLLEPKKQQATAMQCPHCGAENDAEAMFCATCGKPLHMSLCPHCGAEMEPDADYCEKCHHYVRQDVCSFCGGHLSGNEAFCPECGSPRGGIVCPVCRKLNNFSFCAQCGTPLTQEAKNLMAEVEKSEDYREMMSIVGDYMALDDMIPYTSDKDIVRDQMNRQLRERVLTLLAKDRGVENPIIPVIKKELLSKDELAERKSEKLKLLSTILEKLSAPSQPSPVQARNYAMATKPMGVRLAWVCNFKHAMHSSPCGCAKPQLGGKWVILGNATSAEINDDK